MYLLVNKLRNKYSILYIILLFYWSIPFNHSLAENIYIGVASNFLKPIKLLKENFESKNNGKLFISSGSSGSLYAQIINGAPLDIFLKF